MILNKTNLIVFLVGVFLGLCTGFFSAKAIYDQPLEENITRDTVIVYDTIPHYYPKPVEVERVRTEYKWLTRVVAENVGEEKIPRDSARFSAKIPRDSVLVEVPIESRHYHGKNYDAYVSGFEPNLDSIKVYTETKVITNTITKVKSPNKWELDIVGGIDYNTAQDKYTPYAVGELLYKPSRLQVGIQGGIIKADKVEPVVGAKIKYRIL